MPSTSPRRTVVTGASGNLGSALLRRFREDAAHGGGRHVTGLAHRTPREHEAQDWAAVDLADPGATSRLINVFQGQEAVVHLAWRLEPSRHEAELHTVNVEGTRRLLDAAAQARVPHLVVITSVGAYAPGPKDREVGEDHPVTGIPTSLYSRQKAAVEALLDEFEDAHPGVVLTRVRPALIFQADAATEIARLFLGPFVPKRLVGRVPLPVLPLPREMIFQAVHADDVAGAIATVLDRTAPGAFNVAGTPALHPADLARGVRALRTVPVPARALRAVVDATWRMRLQPTDPGWVDLATQVPLMDTARLRALGWQPARDANDALRELVAGFRRGATRSEYPPLAGVQRLAARR